MIPDYVSYACWGQERHAACPFMDCTCSCHAAEGRSVRRKREREGEKYRAALRRAPWPPAG